MELETMITEVAMHPLPPSCSGPKRRETRQWLRRLVLGVAVVGAAAWGCESEEKDKRKTTAQESRRSGVKARGARAGGQARGGEARKGGGARAGKGSKLDALNAILKRAVRCLDMLNAQKKRSALCPDAQEVKKRFYAMMKERAGELLKRRAYVLAAADFVDLFQQRVAAGEVSDSQLRSLVALFNRVAAKHNLARLDITLPDAEDGNLDPRPLDPNSFRHKLDTLAGKAVKRYGVWYSNHGGKPGKPIPLHKLGEALFFASVELLVAELEDLDERLDAMRCSGDKGRCAAMKKRRAAFKNKLKEVKTLTRKVSKSLQGSPSREAFQARGRELRKLYSALVGARASITKK